MLKYIFSLLLVISCFFQAKSQESKKHISNKEANPAKRTLFVRVGTDLSRFVLPYISKVPIYGFEIFADTELKYKFFPTVEVGFNKINQQTNKYAYDMQGYYLRIGASYNMIKYQHHSDRNIFYVGFRYAYSNFYQQANKVVLENEWGRLESKFPKNFINTHWVEGLIGIRGEIINNLFLGFCIRVKTRLSMSDAQHLTPYHVPGFGSAEKKIQAGISYTVSYAIPLKK